MDHLSVIQDKLLRVKPQLSEKFYITSIGLFGSIVRSDFKPESDIDIVVDFSQPIGIEFVDLANELEILLERKVDLVSKNGLRPKYYRELESEIIYI